MFGSVCFGGVSTLRRYRRPKVRHATSLVDDAAGADADAVFEHGCDVLLPLRPLAMHRLFSNLLDNALKYGGSVRVSAERHADGTLGVYVRGRGLGIAEAELETVFAPFVRL